MSDDGLYLIHILERIDRIQQYTASGYDFFRQETIIQDAVLRNLYTLSESTQRVSDAIKDAHPEVGRLFRESLRRWRSTVLAVSTGAFVRGR